MNQDHIQFYITKKGKSLKSQNSFNKIYKYLLIKLSTRRSSMSLSASLASSTPLIAMQGQISARACFSATKVGRHAAVPPFHILLVFRQLHFFFSWLEAPIRHPNIATCCFHDQLSSHVFAFECCSTSEEITAVDNMKIEPAMRLTKIPHYQPWRPKL